MSGIRFMFIFKVGGVSTKAEACEPKVKSHRREKHDLLIAIFRAKLGLKESN